MRKWLVRIVLGGLGVLGVLQLVPYGWWHDNPPVRQDAPWPDAATAELARVACYDCHSNETEWPFYSYVAPMSWLVRRDVELGREALNFSDWEDDASEADDAAESLLDGSMPPRQYELAHPDARLSDEEVEQLAAALVAMEAAADAAEDAADEAEDRADDAAEEAEDRAEDDRSGSGGGSGSGSGSG